MRRQKEQQQQPRLELKYSYSIRGRSNEATTTKDGEIQFFLNIIEDHHDTKLQINPLDKALDFETYLKSFIAYMCALELHEIGHAFNYPVGCNHGTQKKHGIKLCQWCEEVEKIYWWLV